MTSAHGVSRAIPNSSSLLARSASVTTATLECPLIVYMDLISLICKTWSACGQSASQHPGSSSFLILLAKSEIRTIDVRREPENQVCQCTRSCETDFASSIIFGDDRGVAARYHEKDAS
jgi:hypothetical protein